MPHGDRRAWQVPLGPPFLTVTYDNLREDEFRALATELLRAHLRMERRNLLRYQLGVAVHECVQQWRTNEFGGLYCTKGMFWSSVPGENVARLLEALVPCVVNLGVHLQWQNDRDAYRLLDVLAWLDERGALDSMDRGLLQGLRHTRELGVGPHEAA